MKVTVTGAAGRLGSATVRALVAHGYDVHATDRSYRKDLPCPLDIANLLDAPSCYRLVEGADVLLHLGNHPGVWRSGEAGTYAENCTMNINIIQAALEVGVKKIAFASSIQVMAGHRRRGDGPYPPSALAYLPADGDMPTNATNVYSLSKKACEDLLAVLARTRGLQTVAVRFPLLVGEHSRRWMRHPWSDYDALDEAFAYLAVDDAAELLAAIAAADLPGFRIYLPAGPGNLLRKAPSEIIHEYYPDVPLRKPLAQLEALVDISRITADTGWTPKQDIFGAAEASHAA